MFRPGLHRLVGPPIERAVIEALGFQEDHRVVILDGGNQKPFRVIGVRGDDRFQPRNMRENRLGAGAMGLAAENAAAIGRAHRDGG